nr:hypothetical protein [candidate division Zixibacteria bacterium]
MSFRIFRVLIVFTSISVMILLYGCGDDDNGVSSKKYTDGDVLEVLSECEYEIITKTVPSSQPAKVIPEEFGCYACYDKSDPEIINAVLELPAASDYRVTLIDDDGVTVEEFSGSAEAGIHVLEFPTDSYDPGIYGLDFTAGSFEDLFWFEIE